MKDHIRSAQIVVPCVNLNRTLEFFVERLGFRVEMIYPADAPATAVISGYDVTLRLETSIENQPLTLQLLGDFSTLPSDSPREIYSPDASICVRLVDTESKIEIPEGMQEFILTVFDEQNSWSEGRAGMQYRDLIPGRLGGRFVASHIRIPEGGEIPDYVHYHKIRFQMIYCLSGWARLVYEDQGAPFIMKAGDCVLQPPEVRHRVLETSAGFEVLEIGCPAIHETFADHQLVLPNDSLAPERIFGGNQRFVHHIAERCAWKDSEFAGFESCDTGFYEATNSLANVQTLRASAGLQFSAKHSGEFLFYFVTKGRLLLEIGSGNNCFLNAYDSVILPDGAEYSIIAEQELEMIQITLPGRI